MTIARDKTGAVVGQVVHQIAPVADVYAPAGMREPAPLKLLTADGRYVTVPRSSVRLEELR